MGSLKMILCVMLLLSMVMAGQSRRLVEKPKFGEGNGEDMKSGDASDNKEKMDHLRDAKNLLPFPNIPMLVPPLPQIPFLPPFSDIPQLPLPPIPDIPQLPLPPPIPQFPIPQFPLPPLPDISNLPPFPFPPNPFFTPTPTKN